MSENSYPVDPQPFLALDDDVLLSQCHTDLFRASGPGGQHRNKVTSAVRLRHEPTGVIAQAVESRSQHENRRKALHRLRMELALHLRTAGQAPGQPLPAVLAECLHTPKKGRPGDPLRLEVGKRDRRYWPVVAVLLDLLGQAEGRLGAVSERLGVTTGNLVRILKADRHSLAAAQAIRRQHDQGPIT